MKVTRTGNAFTAQHSADGVTWVDVAVTPAVQIAMGTNVYIGLVACSHAADVLTSAEFSNVSTTGAVTGSWQVETIGPAQPDGNASGKLYVTLKDKSGRSKTSNSSRRGSRGDVGGLECLGDPAERIQLGRRED